MSIHDMLKNIEQKKQVFWDNYLIETTQAVTRKMHKPIRYSGNPLITKDKEWERFLYPRCNSFTVLYDPMEKLFKAWYEDEGIDVDDAQKKINKGDIGAVSQRLSMDYDNCYLYAESDDGIKWRKPLLGTHKSKGKDTNICLAGDNDKYYQVHAATFLLDPFEQDKNKRFKTIYLDYGKKGFPPRDTYAAYSRDGRYWTKYNEPVRFGPWDKHILGDVIVLYADEEKGCYVLDTRGDDSNYKPHNPRLFPENRVNCVIHPHDTAGYWMRRIGSTSSKDILNWPNVEEMLIPDYSESNLDEEYYCMARFHIGNLQVGFLNIFHTVTNTLEPELVYSRDGWNWKLAGYRRPFLSLGGEDDWDRYMVEMPGRPIRVGDEHWIYYGGSNARHDWWFNGAVEGMDKNEAPEAYNIDKIRMSIGLARIRLDGYISLDATEREGELLTQAFLSDGQNLIVNVNCGQKGYFQAELLDINDRKIAGYERDDCDIFRGNSVEHIVTWKGKKELPKEVLAKGSKLRFFWKHASLYSFCLKEKKYVK